MTNAVKNLPPENPQTYADIARVEDFVINHYATGCIDIDAHEWCNEQDGELPLCTRCGILE